jgi:hypothetical protein
VRDALAERLLATVMDWSPTDVVRERPILQALALLKYDEYQQFSPGMRFVESLARWLQQFEQDERKIAYEFIRSRLIFLSEAEMTHFAAIMYPDYIRPLLLDETADRDNTSRYMVGRLVQSPTFERLQSSTLFFGLSDGARIDQFRRSNRELSHEQIFPSYQLPEERVNDLRCWLEKRGYIDEAVPAVVLLDDFAGSGASYIREERGRLSGKLPKLLHEVSKTEWDGIVSFPETSFIVAVYVATDQALRHLEGYAVQLKVQFGANLKVVPVQRLEEWLRITPSSEEDFVSLIERYYDPSVEDEHTRKGNTDLKYGFAACGLPLILHHNAPNNALFLLWAENSEVIHALFQRVSRHRRES